MPFRALRTTLRGGDRHGSAPLSNASICLVHTYDSAKLILPDFEALRLLLAPVHLQHGGWRHGCSTDSSVETQCCVVICVNSMTALLNVRSTRLEILLDVWPPAVGRKLRRASCFDRSATRSTQLPSWLKQRTRRKRHTPSNQRCEKKGRARKPASSRSARRLRVSSATETPKRCSPVGDRLSGQDGGASRRSARREDVAIGADAARDNFEQPCCQVRGDGQPCGRKNQRLTGPKIVDVAGFGVFDRNSRRLGREDQGVSGPLRGRGQPQRCGKHRGHQRQEWTARLDHSFQDTSLPRGRVKAAWFAR